MQYLRFLLAVVICALFVHGAERPAHPDSASAMYIANKIKKEAVK